MFTTQIDTSYLIGVIVMALLVLGSVFALPPFLRWLSKTDAVGGANVMPRKWAYGIGIGLAVVMLGFFTAVAFPPFPGQYNQYTPISGTVKQLSSRFLASDTEGGGSNQRFLVTFTNGVHVGCDDTRCSVLKQGDEVTLLCEKVFQTNAIEGWACNFGRFGLNK